MNFSYWERQFITDRADLIIIGGGITGLSTAYHTRLLHPEWKIVVLEKFPISTAASTRNAGFACFGSAGELVDDLASGMSINSVLTLAEKRYKGLLLLRKTLGESNLDYFPCGGTELFDFSQKNEFKTVCHYLEELNNSLKSITGEDFTYKTTDVPGCLTGYENAISNSLEGKLNPGKMIQAWRKLCQENNIEIYCGAEAKIQEGSKNVLFGNHIIHSNQIAVCTNGLTNSMIPKLKVMPARNLVLLTDKLPTIDLPSTYHHDKGYIYFRKIDDRILIGGGRNKFMNTESTSKFKVNEQLKEYLLEYLKNHFQVEKESVSQEWTGIMGVGNSKKVLIKRLDETTVTGVRLGGMGIAIGTLVGKEVSELLR
ncbi:MAG: FAD-dependent oxidoreductase [Flavobacteriales bacterium]